MMNHRAPRPIAMGADRSADYDVVVIGGAFSGASSAVLLKRQFADLRVLIIERTEKFNRKVGEWADGCFHPISGEPMEEAAYKTACLDWLPNQKEADYVKGLMKAVTEPGKYANWIAPPLRGINGKEHDFEYVKL